MNDRVQLKHPQGKKAVSISKEKYNLLRPAVLKCLRTKREATQGELLSAIGKDFKTRGQTFEGSLAWYLEWVKLDLEARKLIRRVPNTSPQLYMIVR